MSMQSTEWDEDKKDRHSAFNSRYYTLDPKAHSMWLSSLLLIPEVENFQNLVFKEISILGYVLLHYFSSQARISSVTYILGL